MQGIEEKIGDEREGTARELASLGSLTDPGLTFAYQPSINKYEHCRSERGLTLNRCNCSDNILSLRQAILSTSQS